MGRAARSAWACHARPTATSVRRSPATGSSSRSSTRTRAVSYPTRSAPLRTLGFLDQARVVRDSLDRLALEQRGRGGPVKLNHQAAAGRGARADPVESWQATESR